MRFTHDYVDRLFTIYRRITKESGKVHKHNAERVAYAAAFGAGMSVILTAPPGTTMEDLRELAEQLQRQAADLAKPH